MVAALVGGSCWRNSPQARAALTACIARPKPPEPASHRHRTNCVRKPCPKRRFRLNCLLRLGGLARRILRTLSSFRHHSGARCPYTVKRNCDDPHGELYQKKLGREAEGPGCAADARRTGQKLYDSVSKEAWQAWLKLQTMLISENRLNLADRAPGNT